MTWTRRLRLQHLHLLINLTDTGSLSDTARIMHTTQPGLSKWLKELEEDIGAPLFERHARGLRPTAMGRLLANHARRMVTEMARAQHNLEALQEGSDRTVAVGTSPASAPSFVPAAIMKFIALHPRARVEVQESTMNSLLDKLELGKLDVVVGRLDNYQPRTSLKSEMLYEEPLRIVARPDHPLAGRPQLDWHELCEYDWIVWPQGTPIRSKLDMALTMAGHKPPPYRVESSSQVSNLWLLQHSDMLSVSSERVARHFTGRGLLVPLNMPLNSGEGYVGMCWRDEPDPDPIITDLLHSLRAATVTGEP
ncbi:putative transcriptional regulator [Oceanimonas sp. GK1]|uniref:LysR substrate-binding domain-containing protein n=1 Tax=Oceanimonas sp. (strain GK1 / IBRC-M 10197) TaxID=511062 RepID=UPI0002494C0B|nr:LysR substrate-binding domain-containing protein [Oceanimonas sp. GK1]AEY00355.1 putative transcriptional regulator [Oceanimonas sp. GK1]